VPGQVVSFLTQHAGFPVPSPAILERIGLRFREAVTEFAAEGDIPVIRFVKGDRTLAGMRPQLDRLARAGGTGVAAIGVAQGFLRVFTGTTYPPDAGGEGVPQFGDAKADRLHHPQHGPHSPPRPPANSAGTGDTATRND
jgi:hypothetical protein